MASTGGPISSLPGKLLKLPENQICDEHPDRFAVYRVQGETDSFGYEAIDMCQECYDEYRQSLVDEQNNTENNKYCELGKHWTSNVRTVRDPDEGSCGPVYNGCPECIKKLNEYHSY